MSLPRASRPPPAAAAQLDIFADSANVALRNAVVTALVAQGLTPARQARCALVADFPNDAALPAFDTLLNFLEACGDGPIASHEDLAALRVRLEGLRPAAACALGALAEPWRRQRWADLARRSVALPFVGAHSEDHAATLWQQAQDWTACIAAVETIPSWRRIPAPLGTMVLARLRLAQEDGCWPLLAELAWIAPKRLAEVLATAGSPLLARLLKSYGAQWASDGTQHELAWFPAWLLCEVPVLAPQLAQAQASLDTAPERGMRLVLELLGLERQGRQADVMLRRRALRDLSPALWAAYIAKR